MVTADNAQLYSFSGDMTDGSGEAGCLYRLLLENCQVL